MDLSSFQTTALRLSARLSENLSETARDLGLQGLDAASISGVGAAGKYLEEGASITEDGIRETKKLLETRREASMAEGLRRVLAMMLKGRPVVSFFPQVVQCLSSSTSSSSSSIQIRSLVSIYILRQASLEPDLALLPVNMYQKDLRDPNPVIRALALRTLAGMGLESIAALVLMSLKTASRDSNWFVRRTVADSMDKLYKLDPSHITSLIPILQTLLADRNPLVLGTSLAAFETICPDRLDLIHPQYRRLCRSLVDADEWSQVVMLRILERYARDQFTDPSRHKMDADLELLLKCTEPLFYNRNTAVVLAAVRVFHRLAPESNHASYINPLLRLLQSPPELQAVVLASIIAIATERPTLFTQQHLLRFHISQSIDTPAVRSLKLQALVLLVNTSNSRTVLAELLEYIKSPDSAFVAEVVKSIGRCATRIASVREDCATVLLGLVIKGSSQQIVQQAISELHQLLSLAPAEKSIGHTKLLTKLIIAFHAGKIASSEARSHLIAILAEHLHLLGSNLAVTIDVLRVAVRGFRFENDRAKSIILLFSTKLVLFATVSSLTSNQKQQLHLLHQYVASLGRYDPSWPVRDLTRFFVTLLSEAGVQLSDDATANGLSQTQQEAQEAFARGESVDLDAAVAQKTQSESEKGDKQKLRTKLLEAKTHPASNRNATSTNLTDLLGAFRLSAQVLASQSGSPSALYVPQLAGWQPLPDWPAQSAAHNLREPAAGDDQGTKSYPTSFGSSTNSNKTKSSKSSRPLARQRPPPEKVVLIPTERDAEAYAKPEPKARDLEDFLQSSEGEEVDKEEDSEDTGLDTDTTEEGTESEEESEEEDEGEESEGSDEDDETTPALEGRKPQ